jgi:hypothetical protein
MWRNNKDGGHKEKNKQIKAAPNTINICREH